MFRYLYIGSAVSGIEKGIKVISDTNLYVAIGLLLVCFLVGPKIEILDSFVNGIGQYIGDFIPDALKVGHTGIIAGWEVGDCFTGRGLSHGLRL